VEGRARAKARRNWECIVGSEDAGWVFYRRSVVAQSRE
jgi:hypothetical protein